MEWDTTPAGDITNFEIFNMDSNGIITEFCIGVVCGVLGGAMVCPNMAT